MTTEEAPVAAPVEDSYAEDTKVAVAPEDDTFEDWEPVTNKEGVTEYVRVIRAFNTFDPIADMALNPKESSFAVGREYEEHAKYKDFEFKWTSDNKLQHGDIFGSGGWVPVREAIGARIRMENGIASRGTMRLVMRPKSRAPFYKLRREQESAARGARNIEEGQKAEEEIRAKFARDNGIPLEALKKMSVRDTSSNWDDEESNPFARALAQGVPAETYAGGSTDSDAYQRYMEVQAAKARGRSSYGGFDGPANKGAVPDSPYFRKLRESNG